MACWQEVVGKLKGVRDNGDGTITLVFIVNHDVLEVTIHGDAEPFQRFINTRIGVLRVDSPDKPYRVRVIGE
ncbi:MAG: hypothetical protein QXV74_03915 [Candidatus Bathyarchaeia archaeon]